MSDYISREAALDVMCEILCDGRENCDENTFCCSAKLMKSIPAADVRPVVLCRDCTFFKPQQKSKRWSSTTPMCSRSATIKMPPDGFCSFGVKREES